MIERSPERGAKSQLGRVVVFAAYPSPDGDVSDVGFVSVSGVGFDERISD